MEFILKAIVETAGVVVIAILGVFLGWRCSRLKSPAWLFGYAVPLLLLGLIVLARRVPQLEQVPPFEWIMAGRIEFVALALISTTLFTTVLIRLQQRRKRVAVATFMVFATVYYSVLPFLLPAFTYSSLSELETRISRDGVCRQSTSFTCGPAAAVTALRSMGVPADEGELAIQAYTTPLAGTSADVLCRAIRNNYKIGCRLFYRRKVAELRDDTPFIAVVKFKPLVDHYVTVLSATDTGLTIGDPLTGRKTWSHEKFREEWRGIALVLK